MPSKYLDQLAQNSEEKLDKHRFLVQSRIVDDQDYNRIVALPTAQRGEEVPDCFFVSYFFFSLF